MRWFLTLLFFPALVFAAESRLCTQNLQRFGSPQNDRQYAGGTTQGDFLIDRFKTAKCDLIAVQEVWGNSKAQALRNLQRLAAALGVVTGYQYEAIVAENREDVIRNGLLLRRDRAKLIRELSWPDQPLPKLVPFGPARRMTRDPAAAIVDLGGKRVLVVSFHFKSKAGGFKDPTKTEFEILRMESAEGVRRWVEQMKNEHQLAAVFVMGDRNNDSISANAQILEGRLVLDDFKRGAACRLGEGLEPLCSPKPDRAAKFLGIVTDRVRGGTFKHRGKEQVLDEIVTELSNSGAIKGAGVVGQYRRGSDHKLAWVELGW